jgi:hypothetical protein
VHAVGKPASVLEKPVTRAGTWTLPTHAAQVLEQAVFEDHLADNENRLATVIAWKVLHWVGWLKSSAITQ